METNMVEYSAGTRANEEQVARLLRAYQEANGEWQHRALAQVLHAFTEIFDVEFKLHLPAYPHIRVWPDRMRRIAWYRFVRAENGTLNNIQHNARYVHRHLGLTLRAHTHELLHMWQHYHGKVSARPSYHNKEFIERAAACGILSNHRGCDTGHTQVFVDVLARHDVDLPLDLDQPGKRPAPAGDSKMKKWVCGCRHGIRAAVALDLTCNVCGERLRRV
jgi:hypothetical protein